MIPEKYVVIDIETNGLLDTVSKFWVGAIYVNTTTRTKAYTNLKEYVAALNYYGCNGYKIVGHNLINYDIPALKILMKDRFKFDPREVVLDTLVLARLIKSNIKDTDVGLLKNGRLPSSLYGSHSLKAWGYRLGELKGTYGESENAWDCLTDRMIKYNIQDVKVTDKLFKYLLRNYFLEDVIRLEHDIQWVMSKQERNGFGFDYHKAVEFYADLVAKREEKEKFLIDLFGSWTVYKGDKIYKRDNDKRGIKAGVPYPQYERVTFKPSSQKHIAKVLQDRGWKPTEFTEKGTVKVDEETIRATAMHIEGAEEILEYLLINKRISQLAEGAQGWLKTCTRDKDGYYRIHGSVNPLGTVTGRASHNSPNLAQVPAARAPYGHECRSLFTPSSFPYQAGIDASGLELRCLSHYLYPFDEGEYAHIVLNGDIHTANQLAAGLPTRDDAKTFIYAYLYGAGDEKIGSIVGGTKADGKRLKDKFLASMPALKRLTTAIQNSLISSSKWVNGKNIVTWRHRIHREYPEMNLTHHILGIDGRPIYVRSPHSALNTLLQSAGAIICKAWVVETEKLLREAGYKHGWDGDFAFMAWVHDEIQVACKTKEVARKAVELAQVAMRNVQKKLKFNCQLDTEGKIGSNWYDCH